MDDTDARSLINAEFIVNQIVGADDEVRQRLIEDLSGAFAASQRAYNQSDVNQSKVMRVLQAGSAVTTDTSGATKDLNNKSLYKTLDFRTQTVQIDASNHEIVRISGGAGSDCLFSVLVSSCFSSLTGWTEGQTYTSLSGCTFKTTATPQLAADYIRDNFSASGVIAICKGTYTGMHIHHDTTVDVIGAGRDVTILAGVGTGSTDYVADSGAAAVVSFRDLTFSGTSGSAPALAVFGNANGVATTLSHITIKPAASMNGAQFNGNEHIDDLVITGPSSGTQGTFGFTSANSTAVHQIRGLTISGCAVGFRLTNVGNWQIDGCYITGANATRGDSNGAGAIALHTSGGATNSVFKNFVIRDSVVGIGCTNNSGSSSVFQGFTIINCATGMDIRGSASGIHNFVLDGFTFILGTAGDVGVDFTQSTNNTNTYCQFTNLNFRGYASGNEILNASGTHLGTGTCGYHNVSDAGTVADFGSPLGHVGTGSGGAAPNNAQYVTLATDATLTSERVLTAGTGITLTDNGAGSTVVVSTVVGALPSDAFVTIGHPADLTGERAITAGTGITITDNGANNTVEIAATLGASVAHELLWFTQTPVTGDNLAYIPIRFNGAGCTGVTALQARAKDYGYGTTTVNLLRAPNSSSSGLPNPAFATVLTSDLNIESSHITMTGIENVTITNGALSATAFAFDDILRVDLDSVNNPVDLAIALTVTVP